MLNLVQKSTLICRSGRLHPAGAALLEVKMEKKERTEKINRLQKKHPGTRRQRSYHGAGQYSVAFFDKKSGELVADYNL